jgi:hypothetical protein
MTYSSKSHHLELATVDKCTGFDWIDGLFATSAGGGFAQYAQSCAVSVKILRKRAQYANFYPTLKGGAQILRRAGLLAALPGIPRAVSEPLEAVRYMRRSWGFAYGFYSFKNISTQGAAHGHWQATGHPASIHIASINQRQRLAQ